MTGPIYWELVLFLGGFAIAEAVFVWWLADQFKKNRHDMNNALMRAISPLRDEVDDLKAEVIRLKAIVNGKH
jgi:hypothetical protein